jgi:hypothetical protein
VVQTPSTPGRWKVRFMMPSGRTPENLPRPNDPDIRFRVEPAREMAVVTFSGVAREEEYRTQADRLRRWLASRGLTPQGEATLAQYDPPWTPWFMRRNEVLLEITGHRP